MMIEGANLPILALDPGRHTGWAFLYADESYAIIYGTSKFEEPPHGQTLAALADWLADVLTKEEPAILAYESPIRFGGGWELMSQFAGVIKLVCWRREILCIGVAPKTIKKHATGSGNASKMEMMAAARTRGWAPKNDHEADALFVLSYARDLKVEEISG